MDHVFSNNNLYSHLYIYILTEIVQPVVTRQQL